QTRSGRRRPHRRSRRGRFPEKSPSPPRRSRRCRRPQSTVLPESKRWLGRTTAQRRPERPSGGLRPGSFAGVFSPTHSSAAPFLVPTPPGIFIGLLQPLEPHFERLV